MESSKLETSELPNSCSNAANAIFSPKEDQQCNFVKPLEFLGLLDEMNNNFKIQ